MGPPSANPNPQGEDWLSWEELLTEVDGPVTPSAAPPAAESAPSELLHPDSFEGLVTPPGVELPAGFQLPPDIQALPLQALCSLLHAPHPKRGEPTGIAGEV